MSLFSRSMVVFGVFSLILFLVFPILFIFYWDDRSFYELVSLGIISFIALFLSTYQMIYRTEVLQQARKRYRENIDFMDVLPNSLFIWRLSVWMFVIELLLTGVFVSFMSGSGFLLMYPLWIIGAGVVFSVGGFLTQPKLLQAGTRLLVISMLDLALLIFYLQMIPVDLHAAHYVQMTLTTLSLGLYPIWLGVTHAGR